MNLASPPRSRYLRCALAPEPSPVVFRDHVPQPPTTAIAPRRIPTIDTDVGATPPDAAP